MNILLVINPAAANQTALRALPEIQRRFCDLGISVETKLTESKGHATRIVEHARLGDFDGVVAGGGDGTVFETVNGLFRNPQGPAIPFGVLPLGTGNSFSRDIGLEKERLGEAVEKIAKGTTRDVDVGRCHAGAQIFHFLNILGVGFVTDVTSVAARLKVLGNSAYTLGVLYRTVFLKTFNARIELDDRAIERDAIFIEISNSRYTADFLMAPEARIDDGLLDVTLLGKISRRRLLRLFPSVFRGEHVNYPEVETFSARHITVVNEHPKALSPDGELVGATPTEITCLPGALRVFG